MALSERHTVIYRIVLAKISQLESTAEPDIETGSTVDPKLPTRVAAREAAEEAEDLELEKVLLAYPEDRIRDRRTCLRQISAAVKAGVKAEDLLLAVKAYAVETESYTRSKVCFADNWFKMKRWVKGLVQVQAEREKAIEAEAKGRASLVEWILGRHPLCKHITRHQIEDLVTNMAVTPEQVRAAALQA